VDFIKLIRSAEELIYEICLWILQTPKTFLKIIRPEWTITYVRQELEKSEKERFQEYVSPMLLWIIIVIAPTFIFLKNFLTGIKPENDVFIEILGASLEIKILVVASLFVMAPLTFATMIQIKNGKAITRESFKENFFIQVYAFTPLEFFMLWNVPVAGARNESITEVSAVVFAGLGTLYGWWFIYYQMRIIKTLLNTSWLKSILWGSVLVVLAVVFTLVIATRFMSFYLPDIE
jgi:hypothetical protein